MSIPDNDTDDQDPDPFQTIREHEDEVEQLAECDGIMGATARYFLAVANGETPDPEDARIANLPELGCES